jgi:glycosyltransferase involved in cell wall biosynthesis
MRPKVSVVMAVFNGALYLRQAVASVCAQSFTDFEFIIVNDGSTDRTRQTLGEFDDPRIRVLDQENRGLIASLNRGIDEAQGEYIARMDADDYCMSERLQSQLEYLDAHPNIALVGSFIATMDEAGRPLAPVVRFPVEHEEIWAGLARRPWVFCHPAVMFRRAAALNVGKYDSAYRHAEDLEFFARLMSRYQAANLARVLLRYRLRRESISILEQSHGDLNRKLVRQIIDSWRPGQPFAATSEQRCATDRAIQRRKRQRTRAQADARYQARIARELLRARKWRSAAKQYLRAVQLNPGSWKNYAGIVCSLVRIGGMAPSDIALSADIPHA